MTTAVESKKLTDVLFANAERADREGRLPVDIADEIRSSGIIRMLQPIEYGGFESHPVEFFEKVLEVGAAAPSAGWICGVVGVHPFEIAQAAPRLQEEIWGSDPDTWIASPYAPFGKAIPVEGGYRFSGRWPFSSGTDNCEWVVIGGKVVDDIGNPLTDGLRHFVLHRSQYEVDQDSWDVIGLKSTGSKDLIVRDAFIPSYRVIDPRKLESGEAAASAGRTSPLYRMHWYVMFTAAITAATLAMAEGAWTQFVTSVRDRRRDSGVRVSSDPHMLATLSSTGADIQASRVNLLNDVNRMYDLAAAGELLNDRQRIEFRRNQVRISRRAAESVESLYIVSGGTALRADNPMQRYWRDIHGAVNHAANLDKPIYRAHSALRFGEKVPDGIRF